MPELPIGTARPSDALRRRYALVGMRHPDLLEQALDNEVAVDVLAKLITSAIEESTNAHGAVDMLDVARAVLRVLGRSQS